MTSQVPGERQDSDLLLKIITYLNDPKDSALVWRGLHFMEANGIDVALRYGQLHAYLTDPHYSPLDQPAQLSHDDEREIVLALRDIVRANLNLPPLSADQKANWRYDAWQPVTWRPDQLTSKPWGETYQPAAEEIAALDRNLTKVEPELMRALRLQLRHNIEVADDRETRQSILWALPRLQKAIAELHPDYEGSAVHNLSNDLLEKIRRDTNENIT